MNKNTEKIIQNLQEKNRREKGESKKWKRKIEVKDLEYHKKELHEVTEKIKQLRRSLGIAKRSSDDDILYKLLNNYKYWVTRVRKGKNINRTKYAKKKIKTFYKLGLSKAFHQSAVIILMEEAQGRERKEE